MANEELRGGIVPLDELGDYKVAEGEPDVRGWNVLAADGTKVGEIDELLVDTTAMKVRYLDVELDKRFKAKDRHVLVPIGVARINDKDDEVLVDTMDATSFGSLPAYTGGSISRDYEISLREQFTRGPLPAPSAGRDYYDHEHFDESRFYGRRRGGVDQGDGILRSEEELAIGKRVKAAGEVEIGKRVETERVHERVPVTREDVDIERRPVEPGMAARGDIGEDEIRVPITEEELVVEKRTVPKEELIVKKKAVQDERVVDETLRKERVDVKRDRDREEDSRDRL